MMEYLRLGNNKEKKFIWLTVLKVRGHGTGKDLMANGNRKKQSHGEKRSQISLIQGSVSLL
jgi:hypothetical protein